MHHDGVAMHQKHRRQQVVQAVVQVSSRSCSLNQRDLCAWVPKHPGSDCPALSIYGSVQTLDWLGDLRAAVEALVAPWTGLGLLRRTPRTMSSLDCWPSYRRQAPSRQLEHHSVQTCLLNGPEDVLKQLSALIYCTSCRCAYAHVPRGYHICTRCEVQRVGPMHALRWLAPVANADWMVGASVLLSDECLAQGRLRFGEGLSDRLWHRQTSWQQC